MRRTRQRVALPDEPLPSGTTRTISRIRCARTPAAASGLGKLVHATSVDVGEALDDELGDAVPARDRHRCLAVVDDDHADLAAVVRRRSSRAC